MPKERWIFPELKRSWGRSTTVRQSRPFGLVRSAGGLLSTPISILRCLLQDDPNVRVLVDGIAAGLTDAVPARNCSYGRTPPTDQARTSDDRLSIYFTS